jgi:ATP-dependent RNA helicase DeaD
MPTDEDVEAIVAERVTALLEARLRERDKLQAERSQRFVPLARSLAENEDESAIIAMLLDDYYQQMLHAPLPQPTEGTDQPPPMRTRRRNQNRRPSRRHR